MVPLSVLQGIRQRHAYLIHYKIYYDIMIAFLSIAVIITFFLQAQPELTPVELSIINEFEFDVWVIFVVDYLTRLILAEDRLYFIRHNIIDLIAIIPFDSAFQGFRAVRFARLIYMIRAFAYLNRVYKRVGQIITTNSFHHVLWFTFSTIFFGAIAISYIEDMNMGDALWWSFVTTTTVGYGDIAPQSLGGRIVAVILMIIGIGFLSSLTGNISSYFISNAETKPNFKSDTIHHIKSRLDDFDNLTLDEIEEMHAVIVSLKKSRENLSS